MAFAKRYHVKNGQPTGELLNIKCAVKPLAELCGTTRIGELGPVALKTVQQRGGIQIRPKHLAAPSETGVSHALNRQELAPASVAKLFQRVEFIKFMAFDGVPDLVRRQIRSPVQFDDLTTACLALTHNLVSGK